MKRLTVKEFLEEGKAKFGEDKKKWKFVCPMCKTAQSYEDLVAVGVDPKDVDKYLGFSCVGRWTQAGPYRKGDKSGKGCDWTLGGLFRIHQLEVVDEEGGEYPLFDFA